MEFLVIAAILVAFFLYARHRDKTGHSHYDRSGIDSHP